MNLSVGKVGTHVSRCCGSPAPPRPASGSVSCGKTPRLRSGPSFLPGAAEVSLLANSFQSLSRRCAHPAAELPELHSQTRIILLSRHLKLHIGKKKKVQSETVEEKEKTVTGPKLRRSRGALPLRTEPTDFYARIILNKGRDRGGGSPRTPACA